MEMDDYENHRDRERMHHQQDEQPFAGEVTEGIFSASKCEPKEMEMAKCGERRKSSERKRSGSCGCKSSSSSRRRSSTKLRKAVNPFIVFYLKYYFEKPSKKVTEVARAAAKQWCRMSDKEKARYIKIARKESRRRQKMKGRRKKKC